MAGGFTTYAKQKILDQVLGNTAFTTTGPWYVGLVTDTNTQAQRHAGTFTEVTGLGYARVSVTQNTTNWPNATSSGGTSSKANGAAVVFLISTAAWGTVTAFFIADAATAGNILAWGDLLAVEKAVAIDDIATDLLFCPAHGYIADDKIKFSSITGITLPTGLTDGAYYFVLASGLVTDGFKVATTVGGSAINITAIGGGKVGKSQELIVGNGVVVQFAVSGLTETLT